MLPALRAGPSAVAVFEEKVQGCMPQMRWLCELYGGQINPFDPKREYEPEAILEKAYHHEQCDEKTVELYLQIQLDWLEWGAHHFPDCCLTTKQLYLDTINKIEAILREHPVEERKRELFRYFKVLYCCYYQYQESEKTKDYYQLCKEEGLCVMPYGDGYDVCMPQSAKSRI